MPKLPEAFAVTFEEGGDWVPFPCKHLNKEGGILVHSIRFNDGSVWDAYNGWRRFAETTMGYRE